jgi:ABC-type lipoprotein release transport system permease subunit
LIAVGLGVPIGVAAGRWAWTAYADHVGVIAEPVVNVLLALLVIPATFLLANLVAALPGRLAARTKPATILRTE